MRNSELVTFIEPYVWKMRFLALTVEEVKLIEVVLGFCEGSCQTSVMRMLPTVMVSKNWMYYWSISINHIKYVIWSSCPPYSHWSSRYYWP